MNCNVECCSLTNSDWIIDHILTKEQLERLINRKRETAEFYSQSRSATLVRFDD